MPTPSAVTSNKRLVGAIDQGTTSTRFVVFDERGSIVTYHQIQSEQLYPQPGWAEQDPYALLDAARACIEQAVRKMDILGLSAADIASIGVTNQRETTLVWDRLTGEPLYPAILWSDARTADTVQKYIDASDKGTDALRHITGLPLAAYFSAMKIRWLLDNVPEVMEAKEQGRLQYGTLDTWLIYVS